MTIQRLGVYGGTFDPIHNGHVEVARRVRSNFLMDELLLVPAARPPHKKADVSDTYHRYAMAVLATTDLPDTRVSTLELEQPDRPYTYQTLERLRAIYGTAPSLFFIMGSDSFEELHKWREPLRILELANLIVAARPGYVTENNRLVQMLEQREKSGECADVPAVRDLRGSDGPIPAAELATPCGRIFLTDYAWRDISSTEVRHLAASGECIKDAVPEPVADYIQKYGVYNDLEN